MKALAEGSRERVYYLFDTVEQINVRKLPDQNEIINEARKLNKHEPDKRYVCKGGWVLHKMRG